MEYRSDGATIATDSDSLTRYIVEYDDMAAYDDPREWSDNATILIYNAARNLTTDDITGHDDALECFARVYDETGDDALALTIAQRYARVFNTGETIDTFTIRGYSQSDWWDVVAVTRDGADTLRAGIDTFGMYLRGDIYAVTRQYGTVCDRGDIHWDYADGMGGIYADSADDALANYRADYEN